jgi:SAM-dependent methyltransferase
MIAWCREHLAPRAPGFEFHHHDVFYGGFNPGKGKPLHAALPCADHSFSLIVAISVFTHLTQVQAEAYLTELARVLEPGGTMLTTWFLFDKRDFPMMQDEQNTLFINEYDVRNAVIYDRAWLLDALSARGLVLGAAGPPTIRGHQWCLFFTHRLEGVTGVELPEDLAAPGRLPPPQMPADADRIGQLEAPSR